MELIPLINCEGGIDLTKFIGDNFSIIGSSHIKSNIVCQDSSSNYICDDYAVAIVCDGHGSGKHFRSDTGSFLASKVGMESIKEFLGFEQSFSKDRTKLLKQLEKNIILNWNNAVNSHLSKSPFDDNEWSKLSDKEKLSVESNIESAYGTTFVAVVLTAKYCFGIQIGDGDCVVMNSDGEMEMPMPEDDRLQFNVTTSLCDKKAILNFRHFWLDKPPIAAIVSTDGVRNSFSSVEHFMNFCKIIMESYHDLPIEQANAELNDFLPRLTERGSGDDVSVSIIYNKNKLKKIFHIVDDKSVKDKSQDNICKTDKKVKNESAEAPLISGEQNEQYDQTDT